MSRLARFTQLTCGCSARVRSGGWAEQSLRDRGWQDGRDDDHGDEHRELGITTMSAMDTAMKGTSHQLGRMNSADSARTVPRSVTNVALMICLPIVVEFRPVSTSTA